MQMAATARRQPAVLGLPMAGRRLLLSHRAARPAVSGTPSLQPKNRFWDFKLS
jgi:hypothetical protein